MFEGVRGGGRFFLGGEGRGFPTSLGRIVADACYTRGAMFRR